jgi:hypothetical protein
MPVEDPSIRHGRLEKRFYDYLHISRSLGLEMTAEIVEGWAEKQIQKRANVQRVTSSSLAIENVIGLSDGSSDASRTPYCDAPAAP